LCSSSEVTELAAAIAPSHKIQQVFRYAGCTAQRSGKRSGIAIGGWQTGWV
jgi:hypothetical protein